MGCIWPKQASSVHKVVTTVGSFTPCPVHPAALPKPGEAETARQQPRRSSDPVQIPGAPRSGEGLAADSALKERFVPADESYRPMARSAAYAIIFDDDGKVVAI